MRIKEIFKIFFDEYKEKSKKPNLSYVVTSYFRPGNNVTNPHAINGNAMDITLRTNGQYSGIKEYDDLFAYMMDHWAYRAGIDNTTGNIHIHLDLGETKVTSMPYFFKEDCGKFLKKITKKEEIQS